MAQKKTSFSGSDIFYAVKGTGSPVLLIHGFAEDSSVWNRQVAALEKDYTLIIPDLPGTAGSEILRKETVSLDDYAACLAQLLDEENIASCAAIGHSMGGYIMLALAEKIPDRLKGMMLFHSSAYADDAEKIASREKGIAFIKEKGPDAFLKATIPGLFYDSKKSSSDIAVLEEKAGKFSGEALIQYYRAMISRPDRTSLLRTFKRPIGFVLGEHDKAVPFKQGLEQTHLPQVSDIHILRQSGHMGMLEETEKATDSIRSFLKTVFIS